MRFGLALPHYDTSLAGRPVSWDGVRTTARIAESAGFDSVWISDHLFLDWGKYGGSDETRGCLECWTSLAAVAASTERVRIGSLALCNDLRPPALVAKMVATLDVLSGGRVDVGLGAGWYQPEYRAVGIEFLTAGARIRKAGEAASLIRRLLRGERFSHSGEFYELDDATLTPPPLQRPNPPVWMGGKGDLLLQTAATSADGWNYSWIGDLDAYRDRARAADRACEKANRDPASLRRSVGAYVVTGRDLDDARERFERLVEVTPVGVLRTADDGSGVSWDQFRREHVAGSVTEVIDKLGALAETGVEEVVVGLGTLPFQVADEDDIRFIGSEIAPALR